jgi:ketosteroid isomerase-like protein
MEPVKVASFTDRFQTAFEADDGNVGMKSHERNRVNAVRRQFEALGTGDMDAFLEPLHPDVELEIAAPTELPWMRRARGIEELRTVVEHNFATLQDQDARLVSITAQGEVVVVVGRECGRIRESGAHYHVYFTYQFTFRENKIRRILEIAAFTQDAAVDCG